jgi:cupin fold WbuC family metalloprotein
MIIDKAVLDNLTAQAKASPRLRMNMDLRNSPSDGSQRMLNAMEPGTVLPIHRHLSSSETVAILRGKLRWHFYDDSGKETESVVLDAHGELRCLNVEKGRWHSLECLESGSVLFECKDGPYAPLGEGEIMKL